MRPANPLDKRKYYVAVVPRRRDAVPLIQEHHYSRGIGNIERAIFVHGMYRVEDDALVGVAVWTNGLPKSAARFFWPNWTAVLHLSRLAVLPDLPTNAASYVLGRSIRAVKAVPRWECLATYADTSQGHTGAIYRATGWEPFGLASPHDVWRDHDGRLVADRDTTGWRIPPDEMRRRGYVLCGRSAKHRFRMVVAHA